MPIAVDLEVPQAGHPRSRGLSLWLPSLVAILGALFYGVHGGLAAPDLRTPASARRADPGPIAALGTADACARAGALEGE